MPVRPFRRLAAATRGAAAVEFALVAPLFLAMLLGIMEFGYQMWTRVSLDYALAQAARCHALNYQDAARDVDCTTAAGAKAYLQSLAVGVRFDVGNLTLTTPADGCLAYRYTAVWLMRTLVPLDPPTYTGTSCYYY